MSNKEVYIGQDFHFGASDAEKIAREIRQNALNNLRSTRCMMIGDWFNTEEENKMHKNELDLLTERGQNKPMYITMEHYSETGRSK